MQTTAQEDKTMMNLKKALNAFLTGLLIGLEKAQARKK